MRQISRIWKYGRGKMIKTMVFENQPYVQIEGIDGHLSPFTKCSKSCCYFCSNV